MKLLGEISRLQVQQARLKTGEGDLRRYNPAPIRSLPALRLGPDGVIGLSGDDEIVDVHHQSHPDSLNRQHRGAFNAISFNFSAHYRQMEARFGRRGADGFAGENILIDSSHSYALSELEGDIIVDSEGMQYRLTNVTVAAPCRPFSHFMLAADSVEPEVLKDTLQFLDAGTRGFLCHWSGSPITIHVGDKVYVP